MKNDEKVRETIKKRYLNVVFLKFKLYIWNIQKHNILYMNYFKNTKYCVTIADKYIGN